MAKKQIEDGPEAGAPSKYKKADESIADRFVLADLGEVDLNNLTDQMTERLVEKGILIAVS